MENEWCSKWDEEAWTGLIGGRIGTGGIGTGGGRL